MKKPFAALAVFVLSSGMAFAHTVTLTWSPAPAATFYKVYRAPGSCSAAFSLMGQVPGTALTFVNGSNPDGTPLVEGQTYCYAVTTVLNGTEGIQSIPVTATIPFPPPPPTNLQEVTQ